MNGLAILLWLLSELIKLGMVNTGLSSNLMFETISGAVAIVVGAVKFAN